MTPRQKALQMVEKHATSFSVNPDAPLSSKKFGSHVFSRRVMRRIFPKDVLSNILNAMNGLEKIKPEFADTIAIGMKEWAMKMGATHYCHWFQPLTGGTAEKHDSFIEWKGTDSVIEKFSGKQLIQGEPDASSFPSGGLRSTFEARGYTAWDPSSPAFIWIAGDGVTLCIPSIFYSWTGDTLDAKIPLLKSDKKISDAVMRLLTLTNTPANFSFSTLGLEQEYFVVDRSLRNLRPDLLLLGRTVYGAASPKGQELEDHYFGVVKDRILAYMKEFEDAAIDLGIPVKTRHNEVAPAQHEVAPVYEKAAIAIDHNLLLMELMRQIACKHNLACLLHEKPFQGINGSGKHSNWSISTDTGLNLLDPTETPENCLNFLILLTAILDAVYEHAALLRSATGSAANDFRLGANEAPPAIISVYLGETLEQLLDNIEAKGEHKSSEKCSHDLDMPVMPTLPKDDTDRNRTSPFAFTGNKFEYRAVGSSASAALPVTVINMIVANSLNRILDEIEKNLKHVPPASNGDLTSAALPVIRKYLKHSKSIRFSGDNYSAEWHAEAERRGLPIQNKSFYAFKELKSEKAAEVFKGVLTHGELVSRYEIQCENYCKTMNIQVNLMLEMFKTQVLPACIDYQEKIASSALHIKKLDLAPPSLQLKLLEELNESINHAMVLASELADLQAGLRKLSLEKQGEVYCEQVVPKCEELRKAVDHLEATVDDSLWPLPKYRELLFLV